MCRKFDRVVTMTEDDAAYLRSYSPAARIRAIPIGIDLKEFAPQSEIDSQPVEALFVGNFRHHPNLEAAEFLIDRLAPRFPHIQFIIAGSHAPSHLPTPANVSFPGYIPDTRTLYHKFNTIVVAPLFSGTGQRVKLLEAFAMASPVITTSVGAKGFPLQNGVHSLIADTETEFIAALTQLISHRELRVRLAMNAHEMIEKSFAWDRIGGDLLDIVKLQ